MVGTNKSLKPTFPSDPLLPSLVLEVVNALSLLFVVVLLLLLLLEVVHCRVDTLPLLF